jgi:septum site-determining protein MinC
VTSANAVRSQQSICLRGRSFMAFVLAPVAPIADWLAELDKWTRNSPDFFVGRPIILDLADLSLNRPEISRLITILGEHRIRILGLEGVDPDRRFSRVGAWLPRA